MNLAIIQLGRNYPDILSCLPDVEAAYALLEASFSAGGKLLVCGNGGSASDADHIVAEMAKGFLLKRSLSATVRARLRDAYGGEGDYLADNLQGALPAISLGAHTALSTAFSNDVAADMVFAQQVYAYGRSGDVLMGLSTSGRSTNVLHAFRVARQVGVRTIGLTGRLGGEMPPLSDVLIRVPFDETFRIQERHLPIYHALCIALEAHFFENAPRAG